MKLSNHLIVIVLTVILSACVSGESSTKTALVLPVKLPSDSNARVVAIQVPEENYKRTAIRASVTKLGNNSNGYGYAIVVELSKEPKRKLSNVPNLSPIDLTTALAFLSSFGPDQSEKLVFEIGRQIASQTHCQNKKVTENKRGRSYTDPAVIAKIIKDRNDPVLGSKVPYGAKGKPLPKTSWNAIGWSINLWCR